MAIFSETESIVDRSQIEVIERFAELNFPSEYKDHLLKYNGGRCTPNVFEFNENGNITSSNIDWFLAIYDGDYDNLKKYVEIYKIEAKRIPIRMLPIAHDPGGNLICISCQGIDEGSVYFWDHEKEIDYAIATNESEANLYLIAESFNEFIAGLKEDFDL